MDKFTERKATRGVPDPELPVEVYLHLSVRLSEEDMQKVQELVARVVVAETKVTALEERMKGRVLVKPVITRLQWVAWTIHLPEHREYSGAAERDMRDDEIVALYQKSLDRMQAAIDEEAHNG